jgi:hypothetical protein
MENRYDPMKIESIRERKRNYKRFLESKTLQMYPTKVLQEVDNLSVDPIDFPARIFGSYAFRVQKYPGDVDTFEFFLDCCSPESVVKKFVPKFKKVVQDILDTPGHYYSETKAGLDHRYDINIGLLRAGHCRYSPELKNTIEELYMTGLINAYEYRIIFSLLDRTDDLDSNEFELIEKIIRNYYVLRWSSEEILRGYKILPLKVKKTLNDACLDVTLLKIDEITFLDGNVTEITNVFRLGYYPIGSKNKKEIDIARLERDPHAIPDVHIFNYTEGSLLVEIEKFYYSNMFYSPFKMIKRLFSYLKKYPQSQGVEEQQFLKKLIGFVAGETSKMYQIRSELETAALVIEKRKIAKVAFNKQLDLIINKIATTVDIPESEALDIIELIDEMQRTTKQEIQLDNIDKISKILEMYINYNTISFLDRIGYNPLPDFVLPSFPKYDRRIVRTPYDHKYNILSEFDDEGFIKAGCNSCGGYHIP